MKSDGIDGDEGLFTGIDMTKRGETVEELRKGDIAREGDGHMGEPVCDRLVRRCSFASERPWADLGQLMASVGES